MAGDERLFVHGEALRAFLEQSGGDLSPDQVRNLANLGELTREPIIQEKPKTNTVTLPMAMESDRPQRDGNDLKNWLNVIGVANGQSSVREEVK